MAWHDDFMIDMFDDGNDGWDDGISDSWTEEIESGCADAADD